MIRFLWKSKCQTLTNSAAKFSPTRVCPSLDKLPTLKYICSSRFRSSTSSGSTTDPINSCGLLDKSHIYGSKLTPLESSQSPNLVLKLFQSRGLSQTQLKDISRRYPAILKYNVEENLKPKIDFLLSVGFSESDLNKTITKDPAILSRSLQNQLIPSFDYLKTLLGGERNAVAAIRYYPRILRSSISKCLGPNLSRLQDIGVPSSRISKMIAWNPRIINRGSQQLSKVALTLKEMGFDPSSSTFGVALGGMLGLSESTWEKKVGIYRSLGFSDDDVLCMFKKQPKCMFYSEERTRRSVEFFVKKFRWSPLQFSARPRFLMFSLEKRVIPRCAVFQVLWSKNKIDKIMRVASLVGMNQKDFLQKYVTKYKEEVPEVLAAYQGKLKFAEYNFDSGETDGAMAL